MRKLPNLNQLQSRTKSKAPFGNDPFKKRGIKIAKVEKSAEKPQDELKSDGQEAALKK